MSWKRALAASGRRIALAALALALCAAGVAEFLRLVTPAGHPLPDGLLFRLGRRTLHC